MSFNASRLIAILAVTVTVAMARAEDAPLQPTLPAKPIPFVEDKDMPPRPAPIELGDPFQGTGKVETGISIPTGTVWNPSLYIYGEVRSGFQTSQGQTGPATADWSNKADVFANLHITDTERILWQVEPISKNLTDYSGYVFEGPQKGGHLKNELYTKSLFFEGETSNLIPDLGSTPLDLGIAVGRQQICFQDGFLICDYLDSLGLTKTTVALPGVSNLRITTLVAWDQIHRGGDNLYEHQGKLYALDTEADIAHTTFEADVTVVEASRDPIRGFSGGGVFAGIGATQRYGLYDTVFRVLTSRALDGQGPDVNNGTLLTAQFATHPTKPLGTPNDLVYLNTYWAIGKFTSAARDPTALGPLNSIGMLFTAPALGNYGVPLNNYAWESYGGALGYQWFLDGVRTQLTGEIGFRQDTTSDLKSSGAGVAARLARKMWQQVWARIEVYGTRYEANDRFGYGLRTEFTYQF